jgi:Deoxyribonuclease NucA/NucB
VLSVSALGFASAGANGVTQNQAPCTLIATLVVVDLDNVKHRHILDHAFDARRKGHPRVLHIRRYEARANRRASLRGIATKPGYDRDEYPPAMSDEGGKGADVRYVLSAENQSAGSVMRHQLALTATSSGSSSSAGVIADPRL